MHQNLYKIKIYQPLLNKKRNIEIYNNKLFSHLEKIITTF